MNNLGMITTLYEILQGNEIVPICPKCNASKEIDDFSKSKNTGGAFWCLLCYRNYMRSYRNKNREKVRMQGYERWIKNRESILETARRKRFENHEESLKKERERRKNTPRTEYMKAYKKENRERIRQIQSDYQKRNREKKSAHTQVNYALKAGKLIKPKHCQCCNVKALVEAHHEDYNEPLAVIWLCDHCHKKRHKEIKLHSLKEK